MKKIANSFYRRHLSFLAGMAALVTLTALPACQDKILQEAPTPSDGSLRFSVQTAPADWTQLPSTKTVTDGTSSSAIKAQEDSMFLNVSIEPRSSWQETVQTRTSQVSSAAGYSTLGVFGYSYPPNEYMSNTDITPDFMYDATLTRSTDGTYGFPNNAKYYLPNGSNVRFFSYAPKGAYGTGEKFLTLPARDQALVSDGTRKSPVFTYSLPIHAINHSDLSISDGVDAENGVVTLNMRHVLTAIKLQAAAGTAAMTINNVTFKNVYLTGSYTPKHLASHQTYEAKWEVSEEQDDITYNGTITPLTVTIDGNTSSPTPITGDDKVFFMIPHDYTAADKASIVIEYTQNNVRQEFTFNLDGQNWRQGETVTYTLSKKADDKFELEILDKDLSINHAGGTKSFRVLSKKGNVFPNYTLQYLINGQWVDNTESTRPAMINSNGKSSPDAAGIVTHTLGVRQGLYRVDGAEASTLQSRGWLDNQGLVDKETANCYVVNQAGNYRFMAVYGNAIKNNVQNNNVVNKGYQKGDGTEITSPYLPNDITAELVWEDTPGLVSNVAVDKTTSPVRITFTVGGSKDTYKQTIRPRNALIAAKKNGTILWSWHIWVTPKILANNNSTIGGKTFFNYPIGFVEGGTASPVERSCTFRVRAEDPDTHEMKYSNEVTLTQTTSGASSRNEPGRYPTFQWGRKEPMWPASIEFVGTAGAPLYNANGGAAITSISQSGLGSQATRIQNPLMFNNISNPALNGNLWNASATDAITTGAVTKSIFDPCPAGYHVPQHDAFVSGFTKATGGEHATTIGNMTATNSTYQTDFGLKFSGGLFLPFGGCRRLKNGFVYENARNSNEIYYGGSWTAGRQKKANASASDGPTSVLTYMMYAPYMAGANFQFWPRLDISTTSSITDEDFSHPMNCWPIMPQKE